MTSSASDLLFLQQLYGQDTLYVISEEQANGETVSFSGAAKVAPAIPQVEKTETAAPAPDPVSAKDEASPAPAPIPAPQLPAEEIRWLGEAVHGTHLLFEVPEAVFSQLPQHTFLQKVMAAVGLTTNQVKFGNMSPGLVHDVKQIAASNKAKHIILFGQGLPVANLSRMEFYRMYRFEESRFVLVDSLEDIEKSVELKKKLWDVLQKIFLQQN
ncbi:hypothetical protein [Rufibacter sp. XAAS-G3-1]|uniref:hypothetical protein n=1 Tax=Rufibacter sp. XAAS-G3-1 TaxID=2729134 RepID=UPI0015E79EC5|nr:hypothetical protein [Rufibacter sp. XAAS-G3-1]